MENISTNNPEGNLDLFRAEINNLINSEKTERKTIHFPECDPNELGEEERVIYEKYKSWKLSDEEIREYKNRLTPESSKSKKEFGAYISNMLTIRNFYE
ncbi:MAG: hypothetical protein WCS86_00095 [Candidatus Paceibacterota bacterium]